MEMEPGKCNGSVKLEESPSDVLITYKRKRRRRRRMRGGSSADASKVLEMPSGRTRDIGWDHGEIVDGNRFHWMCNWCGLIRYGGGVSRLKNHLAGTSHVRKCPNVPADISKSIMNHLIEKSKRRKKRSTPNCRFVGSELSDSHNVDAVCVDSTKRFMDMREESVGMFNKEANDQCKITDIGTKSSKSANQHSGVASQLPETEMTKMQIIDPAETVTYTDSQSDRHGRICRRWKSAIECQLELSYLTTGQGVWNVLHDALSLGHSQLPQKLMTNDVIMDSKQLKDIQLGNSKVKLQCHKIDSLKSAEEQIVMESTANHHKEVTNTRKCEKAFLEILISAKFALLCDFLLGIFDGNMTKTFLDFSLIDSKFKSGDYEQVPELFNQDVEQMWNKLQKFGEEMTTLASNLSCHREETCQLSVLGKNSVVTHAVKQLTAGPDCSTKPDHMESSNRNCTSTCKKCEAEANGDNSLPCDGCNAMYHFSCIDYSIKDIPTRSWFCAACRLHHKNSADPVYTGNKKRSFHRNCVVCDRLEFPEIAEDLDENGSPTKTVTYSGDTSVSSMESADPDEPSKHIVVRLCKICGACEDEDRRFLVCGHIHCPYKFFHIRCLRTSQIASAQQENRSCWYCPSCLCRACLCDRDDDRIVLCDGCDEAYHTYCMKPPRAIIPTGKWYCVPCNVARARDGMRRYEEWILQQHNGGEQSIEAIRSMDLLLSAAEKLSSEEKLSSQR
ncbi:PHD finger protein EHD3-like isoform X2 [Zingiber officinale]|uniref:PHD finger protein EHD3-like isoform X2 n=1 Tax=Zingiber officinale TaxID=94328 RepID=UPI001C4BE49C|nr:PHD finger protein EHD3-like isoform X2 [Zingiber officinale]